MRYRRARGRRLLARWDTLYAELEVSKPFFQIESGGRFHALKAHDNVLWIVELRIVSESFLILSD